jgi:hypothetical protein
MLLHKVLVGHKSLLEVARNGSLSQEGGRPLTVAVGFDGLARFSVHARSRFG